MQHRSILNTVVFGLNLVLLCSCASSSGTNSAIEKPTVHSSVINPEDAKLVAIVNEYTIAAKRIDPYYAPYFNVEEDLSKFGDYLTDEQRERGKTLRKTTLSKLDSIDMNKLESSSILYHLFRDGLERGVQYYEYPLYLFDNFNQMGNRLREYIDDSSPSLTSFPFDSVKHYRDFIKRSEGFPAFVDRQIAILQESAKRGYALNCTIAKSAIHTYKDALEKNIEKNPFYRPVVNMPKAFNTKDREELKVAYHKMIEVTILPAFEKFDTFYRESYLPKCRSSYGIGSLTKGAAMYRYQVRQSTDLPLSPNEVHATGLKEVARIKGEMQKIQKELGIKGSFGDFLKVMVDDEKYYFKSAKEMFDAFNIYGKRVDAFIPKYFTLIPKTGFRLAESENSEDAAASYRSPTDFQPYGRFVVNTKNLKGVPRYRVETLYLHEAIPGHHFQLAIQFERKKELTEYQRKISGSSAFIEGWALYTERLGREEGWLTDKLAVLGSLKDEMLRAVRLVVDTGIHSKGWSRSRTIEYMKANLASDIRDIEIEADRYSVWPGQALAYKTGQLKILALREDAKKTLGAKFDIKEFHRVVIQNGSVSLGILESEVAKWVDSFKN